MALHPMTGIIATGGAMSTSFLVFPGGRSRLVNPIKLLDARPSKRYGMDVCADLGF